jgi:undecaprenyl-diphosphatase
MMRVVTHLGGARATLLTGLILTALGGELRHAGLVALLGNALSHVLVQVLKRAVARPRPCDARGVPLALVDLPDPFSFPSGHSAAAFAVALPVAMANPLLAPAALGLAVLVAASRVQLRVHYLSDVLAGVVLGVGGFIAAERLVG